jgi:1,2-phenylacetyl-CoA epoxidase PaaB subunit
MLIMRAIVILLSIFSVHLCAQEVNVPTKDDGQEFINYATEISKLSEQEFDEYGDKAVRKFTSSKGDDMLDVYGYAHALKNPETALVAGTQVYHRRNSGVNIPNNAEVTGQNEYTSMGNDWLTYDLKDGAGKYYSITLNKKKHEVVSRFVNKDK